MSAAGVLFCIITKEKILFLLCALGFVFLFYQMLALPSDKNYSHQDSEILVKELKRKVDAVNQWNK